MVVVLGIVWVCENGERRARKERWGSFVILGCYKGARRNRLSLRGVSFGQRASKMANLRFGQKCKFAYLHARQNQNWHFSFLNLHFCRFQQCSDTVVQNRPQRRAWQKMKLKNSGKLSTCLILMAAVPSTQKCVFILRVSQTNSFDKINTFAFFRSFELQCKAWVLRRRIKPSIKW